LPSDVDEIDPSSNNEIIDSFKKIFSNDIQEFIVERTNIYARAKLWEVYEQEKERSNQVIIEMRLKFISRYGSLINGGLQIL
jgi:hypothetical protein